MNPSDALWLKIWETVATVGFVMVLVGVVIEGVEHFKKFTKKDHARKLHIEKIGWLILVAGLAAEFLGDQAAKRISTRDNARLNQEAGDARRDAGNALLLASVTESTNLVLRKVVAELEIKLRPRRITPQQKAIFIDWLKSSPRCPVNVFREANDNDTITFANQVRELLDDAGYGTGKANDVLDRSGGLFVSAIGDPARDLPLGLVFYAPYGQDIDWPDFKITVDAKTGAAIVNGKRDSVRAVPGLIDGAFQAIGITPAIGYDTNFLKPGEWGVYIPQKF